jgi:hypothetical protein
MLDSQYLLKKGMYMENFIRYLVTWSRMTQNSSSISGWLKKNLWNSWYFGTTYNGTKYNIQGINMTDGEVGGLFKVITITSFQFIVLKEVNKYFLSI